MIHHTVISNGQPTEDTAVMYLHADLIDEDTKKQIRSMISHPSLSHIRVMPDGHAGNGCCIGFTGRLTAGSVVPSYVGGDIGCGILTYPLRKKKLNLKRIESIIKTVIPMGDGPGKSHPQPAVSESYISRYLAQAQPTIDRLCAQYDVPSIHMDFDYFISLCDKIEMAANTAICSFGTLGSGNHFVEVNVDDNGQYFLTIHSGSRSFGMKLFEYHYAKVDRRSCLDNLDAVDYFIDLVCAQCLAKMNRHIMLQLTLREMAVPFVEADIIESTHNYIDFDEDEMILRKGAISAKENELCIIALNMRDGIVIGRGLGNTEWNSSCAHGCGRVMTRSEARRRIKLKDYKKAMQDVVSTCVCEGTLDEAPQAYKDMNIVLEAIQPTVVVESHLISVINLKGTS